MIGLKEICALLVAGGMGAGSVVAVQQAKPKPRVERKAPVRKAAATPAPRPSIPDCPTIATPPGGLLVPEFASPLPSAPQVLGLLPPAPGGFGGGGGGGWLPPGGGGGGGGGVTPPAPPAIPEPAAWAMMISGFGLVGAALRLRLPADGPTTA